MLASDSFVPPELPAELREAYGYWRRIKGSHAIPVRSDFDPIDIPSLLPHVVLVEVLRDRADRAFQDFRFRLIGTYVDERMNGRYVGERLSKIYGKGPGSKIWSAYCEVSVRPETLGVYRVC